jgi:hypothetical protein
VPTASQCSRPLSPVMAIPTLVNPTAVSPTPSSQARHSPRQERQHLSPKDLPSERPIPIPISRYLLSLSNTDHQMEHSVSTIYNDTAEEDHDHGSPPDSQPALPLSVIPPLPPLLPPAAGNARLDSPVPPPITSPTSASSAPAILIQTEDDLLPLSLPPPSTSALNESSSTSNTRRSTYRKRPKRDLHAPIAPKTAYQMFMDMVREDLKSTEHDFTRLAHITSARWKVFGKPAA